MLHDFLSFGTPDNQIEIANSNRFAKYAPLFAGSAFLSGLQRLGVLNTHWDGVDVDGYTTPEDDDAPWYVQGIQESRGFGGFCITDVRPAGSTFTRTVLPGASGGGMFTPGLFGPRSLDIDVWAVGAGQMELEYGFEWFTQILVGRGLDPCEQTMARWFAGDPRNIHECGPNPDGEFVAGFNPEFLVRRAYDARLTGAPTIIDRWKAKNQFRAYQFTFQISFGSPYVYTDETFGAFAPFNIGGAVGAPVAIPCCEPDVGFSPPCFAQPVELADLRRDNCWQQPTVVRRGFQILTPDRERRFAPIVTLDHSADVVDALNYRIAFYRIEFTEGFSVFDLPTLWECERKLGVIEIPFIPAGSTVVLDGRTQGIELTLADGTKRTEQIAQGENGTPLHIPASDGTYGILVVVEADDANAAPNATMLSELASQFLTTGGS